MSTPTAEPSTNAPTRKGFYLRGWVLAAVAVLVVAAGAVAIGFAVSDGGDGHRTDVGQEIGRGFERGGGRFGDHGGGDGRVLGIIVLLIIIALAIAAAVFIARRYASRSDEVKTSAEELLAERFARGEIDEADYLSRRHALRS